ILYSIEHMVSIARNKEHGLAFSFEAKPQLILVVPKKTMRRDNRSGGNSELVDRNVVGENAARNVVGLFSVVIKFDEIGQGWIPGVSEQFVYHDVAQWIRRKRIQLAR